MKYEIVMAQEAYDRFRVYTDLCSLEIAAFGYCEPVAEDDEGSGFLYVEDIFLVPQEVTEGSVDFMTKGLPYAIKRAQEEDKVDKLRFCVHSHVNMGVGFSNIDEDMIAKIGKTGTPWFASAIFNKRGETNARVDVFRPDLGLPGTNKQQVTVYADLVPEAFAELEDQCRADIDEFVTEYRPQLPKKHSRKAGDRTMPGRFNEEALIEAERIAIDHHHEDGDGEVYVSDGFGRLVPLSEAEWDELSLRAWEGSE